MSRYPLPVAASLLLQVLACSTEQPIRAEVHLRTPGALQVPELPRNYEEPPEELPPEPEPAVVVLQRNQCRPGQRHVCTDFPRLSPEGPLRYMGCAFDAETKHYYWHSEDCATPIVVSLDDAPVVFTRPLGNFAIGYSPRTEWVSATTPWLARDLDGSGCIESQDELFGVSPKDDASIQNGFDKLSRLDDNGDGFIDARDSAFSSLVLWADKNQDRRCTLDEVTSLSAYVRELSLTHTNRDPQRRGSYEGEAAPLLSRSGGEARRGRLIDVYLSPM